MRVAVVALACLAATACGATGALGGGQDEVGRHMLTVQQTYAPAGGVLYIEGAVAEVELVDAEGRVRTTTGDPSHPLTFAELPAGSYVVRPGLLPCEANCGNLGNRTDECEAEVSITGDTVVRVAYTPTKNCEAVVAASR